MKIRREARRQQPGAGGRLVSTLRGVQVAAAALVGTMLAAGCASPAQDDALELSLPATGAAMTSCLPFTVENLAGMTPAFAGTVTDVTDGRVTLDVDRWYAGGSTSTVVLQIPPGASAALIGEIDFQVGGRYLITAAEGTVNMCGYSGPATSELAEAFEAAF